MTIVVNEIIIKDGLLDSFWVAAADSRITLIPMSGKNTPTVLGYSKRTKLFHVPYLNAAVSYFGHASISSRYDWKTKKHIYNYMDEFMRAFIRTQASRINRLDEFANELARHLNLKMAVGLCEKMASGFHLCGFNQDGLPEFWFIRNADTFNLADGSYSGIQKSYSLISEEFLARDVADFGFDGTNPDKVSNVGRIYRNGDIRIAQAVWTAIDQQILPWIKNFQGSFTIPSIDNPEEYSEYVKFKCEYLAYLYKNWAKIENIARPIDVLVLKGPHAKQSTSSCEAPLSLTSAVASSCEIDQSLL